MKRSIAILITVILAGLICSSSAQAQFGRSERLSTSRAKLVAGLESFSFFASLGKAVADEQTKLHEFVTSSLTSREMSLRARARLHELRPELDTKSRVEIQVYREPNTNILQVFATSIDAELARHFLDALLAEFEFYWKNLQASGPEGKLAALEERARKVQNNFDQTTKELDSFRQQNPPTQLAQSREDLAADLQRLRTKDAEIKQRLKDLEVLQAKPEAVHNLELGFNADGTARLEPTRGLTATELDHQKTRAEALHFNHEISFWRGKKDSAEAARQVRELELRAKKAAALVQAQEAELSRLWSEEQKMLNSQMEQLSSQVSKAREAVLQTSAKMAEQAKLEDKVKAERLSLDTLLQQHQTLQQDPKTYAMQVAIMQSASPAMRQLARTEAPWELFKQMDEVIDRTLEK